MAAARLSKCLAGIASVARQSTQARTWRFQGKRSVGSRLRPKKQVRIEGVIIMPSRTENTMAITLSCGNVFADFGVSNANYHLVKANLASALRRLIQERKLNQAETAELLGTTQTRISNLFNNRIDKLSFDLLLGYMDKLEQDVEIFVRPRKQ